MKPCTVNDNAQDDQSPKQDIYTRITAKIVAALEKGVRPWVRPWNAEHAAGRITRPLRHNGKPSFPTVTRSSQGRMTAFSGWRSPRQTHRNGDGALSHHARSGAWYSSLTAVIQCSFTQQKLIPLRLSAFHSNPSRNHAVRQSE